MSQMVQILWKATKDITGAVDMETVQGTITLTKQVGTFQFDLKVTPANSSTIPVPGDQIDVWVNGTSTTGGFHLFGGTVTEVETTIDGGILQTYTVYCTDWSWQLSKKLVVQNFANVDPGQIVLDLMATYSDGSFTTSGVNMAGFPIQKIKFDYVPLNKAIQQLCNLIGWDWNVDPAKGLHFFLTSTAPAPFNLDDTSGNQEWPSLDVDINLTNMKNSVFVKGGTYYKIYNSSTTPDKYTTVAGQLVYSIAYPYDLSNQYGFGPMIVSLGGVNQTISSDVPGAEPAGYQVYYNDNGRFIRFASDPGGGQALVVYGTAKVPIVAHAQDSKGIATYGEIQDVISDTSIGTLQQAQMRAKADILQYGHAVYTVKFNTLKTGLYPGQIITLNSTILNVNVSLTIKQITVANYSPSGFLYQVEAYGSDQVNFIDIMSVLLQQQNQNTQTSPDSILEAYLVISEALALSDTLHQPVGTKGPYKWGTMKWGYSKWSP